MSKDLKLAVQKREIKGTGECRRLRKAGIIPGVVYNSKTDSTSIQLDAHKFGLMLREHGENMIFDLSIDDAKPLKVILKEVQYNPVKGEVLHIDLTEISMTEKLQISIPVELVGDSAGVEEGGVLEQLVSELDVECLPGNIVETLEIDVSELSIGDHLNVSDINFDSKLTILTDGELVVAAVSAPRKEEEEEPEAVEGEEGESAEPEVIGEKKEEEGEKEENTES